MRRVRMNHGLNGPLRSATRRVFTHPAGAFHVSDIKLRQRLNFIGTQSNPTK